MKANCEQKTTAYIAQECSCNRVKTYPTSAKTILIVDDSKLNRAILCKLLTSEGYTLLEAENSMEALDILSADASKISLVLLDISMPVMDGYSLLRKMNEQKLIASVPVIIMTGNEDEDAEIRCLQSGASDFIRKPYNAELIRNRVRSILRLWDNAALINRLETDELTGLYSKEFFYRYAEERLAEASETPLLLIYVDVDDFKMLNARHGSAAGDELLKYLADIIKEEAGERGVCGRLGADIFAALIENRSTSSQEETGSKLRGKFRAAPIKGAQIKIGIYNINDRTVPVPDMCDSAKLALSTIKHQYGVYYAIYDDSVRERAMREHQLADGMAEALEKKQFVVYLQPKHCTESGAVAGAEALVRWYHPELGFITPGEFIPLFERNGFITRLDYYMWDEVCRIIRSWLDRGIKPIPISANASRADFVSFGHPEKIEQLVDSYGIPHELIHFEVTESAYTDHPQQIVSAVSTLRDMGFLIEMDDFGSGYSSLNMLSELPIDILKLDMRFMQGGDESIKGGKRNILSFVIGLSKWMQLPTVAEGVETEEEYELLKSMGCNLIQGYYFAKPMPVSEFEKYMIAHPESCKPEKKKPAKDELNYCSLEDRAKPLVLVAEDIDSNRTLMRKLLLPEYRVVTEKNGRRALEYIKEHRKDLSCILLDLLLPVLDGFKVLAAMSRDGITNDIPVIITTETGSNSELKALRLGAADFLSKPYNPELLLHHVKKAVEEKQFRKQKREFEAERQELYDMAFHDELTGLLNRHGLKRTLDAMPKANGGTVIILDVDNLKTVNDEYGHAAGDKLIHTVAEQLIELAEPGAAVARLGGDEFILILPNANTDEAALAIGERLCNGVGRLAVPGGGTRLSCSAGAVVAKAQDEYEEIYHRADRALYEAKRKSKGSCVLWNERMR